MTDDTEALTCKMCGTKEDVQETIDPFLEAVYQKEVIIGLCPDCYRQKLIDI